MQQEKTGLDGLSSNPKTPTNWEERAKQLVEDHWAYHDILIPIFLQEDPKRFYQAKRLWGKWYKAIGLHFYKHAIEDIKEGIISIPKGIDSEKGGN